MSHRFSKNNKISNRLREIGNKHYAELNHFDALISFNKSLCFAIPGSNAVSFAYANRSAVYLDLRLYENCLKNIQLARDNDYPKEKLKKLIDRENRCKLAMLKDNQEPVKTQWDFFKLTYKPHPKIPFLASCLEMRDDKVLGPHLITNRDLKSGDFIAITDGALNLIDPLARLHRCSWCVGDFFLDLIPCTGCPMAMFCSEKCFEKGKHYSHYEHCSYWKDVKSIKGLVDGSQLLCTKIWSRILAMFHEDPFDCYEFLELQSMKMKSQACNYFDFDWTSMDQDTYDKTLLLIALGKHKNLERVKNITSKGSETLTFVDCLINALLKTIEMDLILSRFISVPGEKSSLTVDGNREIYKSAIVSNYIGFIMSPIQCFTAYSCAPNCNFLTIDNKIILMVLRPIKAGEKITVPWGPTFLDSPINIREKESTELFGEPCRCVACVGDWRIFETEMQTNPSTSQDLAIKHFCFKTTDINKTVNERNPKAPEWVLLSSIELDAKILAKPAHFYP